jgi:hypothetical protein
MYRDKKCIVCGSYFSPKTGSAKTCPGFCREELRRFRERKSDRNSRPETEKVCPFCASVFKTRDSKRKYCFNALCNKSVVYEKNKRADRKRLGLRSGYSRSKYLSNQEAILARKKLEYREKNSGRDVKDGHSTTKLGFDQVKELFSSCGYSIINMDSYVNTSEKLDVLCPKGHHWSVSYHHFRGSGKVSGHRCPKCQIGLFQSRAELAIIEYFRTKYTDIRLIERDRESIGLELDLLFPEKSLAVEYCGLYWHGENLSKKLPGAHRHKLDMCSEKGIRLITVFEDEYIERKEIVLSRIEAALGLKKSKVYARNCLIKQIPNSEARDFFSKYHLQGSSGAKVCFGLYHNDVLVQVMSLGSLSRAHAGKSTATLELKRLASVPETMVIGGASKLFSCAKKWAVDNKYVCIKSYCDMRWANTFKPIYEVLGFELVSETKCTPHYVKGQKRYRNQSLRKTPAERLTGKTEWELRKAQGFDRIWDCGHRTYIYNL